MLSRKNKAGAALCFSVVLYAAVYPYRESFGGGLVASGCLAALIGGLADWFAICALFHRPLGIPWRTEIVPRNRERLFREILAFTAEDLLSKKNISGILRRYDTSRQLIAFLENSNGREKVKAVLVDLTRSILDSLELKSIAERLAGAFQAALGEVSPRGIVSELLLAFRARQYEDKAAELLFDELARMVRADEIKQILVDFIDEARLEYEGESARRQLMGVMLHLSSEKLSGILQDTFIEYLEDMRSPSHPERKKLGKWLYGEEARQKLFDLTAAWRDSEAVVHMAENLLSAAYQEKKESAVKAVLAGMGSQIEVWIERLKADQELQNFIDRKIKAFLRLLLNRHHGVILRIVEKRLQAFSNEELSAFIERRVADDLQMIRINGSLVGALAGMALYLAAYAAERMWPL